MQVINEGLILREYSEHDIRYNSRRAAMRRKRRNQMICIIIALGLVFGVIIGIAVFKNQSNSKDELLQFQGTWIYDEYTQYEFDGNGNGCMCLEDLHYEYTYTIKNDMLKLDFKDDSVRDCIYTFLIENNTLKITGGEGTASGTYKLYKQN